MVLNDVTKFHKILVKSIRLKELTWFQMVNFHKKRAITTESMVRYGLLLNLKKFHKILIKSIRLRKRTSLDIRTY